ncbi:glycosyltransferase family 2 protein [Flavobacterium franklandianum]|uniref:glycosyltransferase family 2 protein n=1 Tax=Flavobacterium franklandianum TaxID=2594430 RepID=UPI00117A03D7|nr:glycosyltransferase family A protein [Flavobacterium franklandianum]TRX24098.1 glycosyltransferase family 2 protein [Flavobacterium franklandianum]
MLIVYHNRSNVVELANVKAFDTDKFSLKSIASVLVEVAKNYPEEILVWCHQSFKKELNVSAIEKLLHHKKVLLSYNPSDIPFLDSAIGYIDASLFVQINKVVSFPTWQMSSMVGCVYAEVLLALHNEIPLDENFDYFLCSLAKLLMPKGLLCYSEPRLLNNRTKSISAKTSQYTLFRFVKQHYRTRWVFLLLFNLFIFERKFPLLPFLFSLFYKNRSKTNINLDDIKVQSSRKVIDTGTVDVIIPTIGRKNYLYDVLKDFSKQTLLPKKIIIVEQNPETESTTELDYLTNEKWPFEIQHIFTHQAGACNARNLALKKTQSEWVFLADDDNRFEATLLSDIFSKVEQYGNEVVTTSYPQKNEIKKYTKVIQWPTFGAGNSFVPRAILTDVKFNKAFEFGYGEDGDFGMQLRNLGYDILYLPEPEILHLKAPVGGYRTKPVLRWHNESIQPKPSPTIMLYQMAHCSKEQMNNYKTILFFKYYKFQTIKNPIRYYIYFQKQWKKSVFWANELNKKA